MLYLISRLVRAAGLVRLPAEETSCGLSACDSEIKVKAGKRMFAVIETGGKQYKVQYGDEIFVEKLDAADGDTVEFPVIALFGEGETKVGAPYVDGAKVTGKVVKSGKAKKITVFTYKAKKNVKRKMGHRQPYTKVQIEAVNA